MHHHQKIQSLVLTVLFVVAMLSSVENMSIAPKFKEPTASNCNDLKCPTTGSNGTPSAATSSGDDSLPTKKGVSTDLNLSGNDQLTETVSLAGNTEIGMKVTTGDVLSVVSGTDSKRITKSTTDGCITRMNVGLPTDTTSETIPQRAMCQWVYTTNTDESRKPEEMQFAELKEASECGKCFDSAGKVVTDRHCELVHYQAQVQRKINNVWVPDQYEDVPVAGVCVRRKQ